MILKHYALRFVLENFADLPSDTDKQAVSSKLADSDNHHWRLAMYPGGKHYSEYFEGDSGEKKISIYIHSTDSALWCSSVRFTIRDKHGNAAKKCIVKDEAGLFKFEVGKWKGFDNLNCCRSFLLDNKNEILLDGALYIDVHIQACSSDAKEIPEDLNRVSMNLMKMLEDEEDTDVIFEVGDAKIRAHKNILKYNCQMLADAIGQNKKEEIVIRIPSEKATKEVFMYVLNFIYAGKLPSKEEASNKWKDLLVAANYFGLASLKRAVEIIAIFQLLVIGDSNVSELIMFAHAHNCPILKENAISYFASRGRDSMTFNSVDELMSDTALFKEVVCAMDKSKPIDPLEEKSVFELQKKLDDNGLDIDGPKQDLMRRVKRLGSG